jgi:secretion/DNA translocation related CpaE-like protein
VVRAVFLIDREDAARISWPDDRWNGDAMDANQPVALVEDDDLLDDVLKVAAAAGCPVERVPDAAAVRLRWSEAPLVIVDGAGARACLPLGLPRRRVVVVCAESPPKEVLADAVELGAEKVLTLPGDESWLVGVLADVAEAPAGASGRVLAVLGGRGGGGASVFAASVGLTVLRDGDRALLIDCDPLGGGLDLVIGAETEHGLRWPEMRLRAGRVAVSSLHAALPGRTHGSGRLTLLSGAREGAGPEPDAVAAVLEAGRRGGETVICDLPRSLDAGAGAALDRADLVVLVVPAEVRACVGAKIIARQVLDRGRDVRVVVRGPAPGRLDADDVADAVGVPLLAPMRPEPALAESLECGQFRPRPRGPLSTAARITLRALEASSSALRVAS